MLFVYQVFEDVVGVLFVYQVFEDVVDVLDPEMNIDSETGDDESHKDSADGEGAKHVSGYDGLQVSCSTEQYTCYKITDSEEKAGNC